MSWDCNPYSCCTQSYLLRKKDIVDPDNLASEEAMCSGATLFSTLIENACS